MAKTVSNREYIPPAAVDTDEISDSAITSAKISGGAVTQAKAPLLRKDSTTTSTSKKGRPVA